MIAQLSGKVARIGASFLVLDVNGVGYKVSVPVSVLEAAPAVGEPLTVVTTMLVREDDISLYGFLEEMDQRVFDLLLTVSGVGPKAALAFLSAMTAEQLANAVGNEDVRTLTKVPGVGAKTAQRMVLELKEKLLALGFERRFETSTTPGGKSKVKSDNELLLDDVVSALVNLGYNKNDAQKATEVALNEKIKDEGVPEFAALLRAALNRLTR